MEPLRACALAGTIVLAACGATGGSDVSAGGARESSSPAPAGADDPAVLKAVDPAFLPALESLQAALRAGEDETARLMLEQVLARGPRGRTLEVTRAFERVLDGRAALRELELTLEFVDEPDGKVPRDLQRL